jgi:hypothetical protein
MATLAERMEALRGMGSEQGFAPQLTEKQEAEMQARAEARKAARALAKGAGIRNAGSMPTGEADKLAAAALVSVSSGSADQEAVPGNDGGELVLVDEPKRNRGGNPAFQKGKPNPYLANTVPDCETVSHIVKSGNESNALALVQNQLISVAGAMADVPEAVKYLGKVVRGRVQPNNGRLSACYDLLNRCGITHEAVDRLEKLRAAPGGGVDLAGLAGALARASELANRRKQAETVQIHGQNTGNAQGEAA